MAGLPDICNAGRCAVIVAYAVASQATVAMGPMQRATGTAANRDYWVPIRSTG